MSRLAYGSVAVAGALGMLALVVWLAGPAETLETVARLRVWQAVVLVATAFGVSWFTALAWRAILRRYGHSISVWLLFRLTMVAFAAGWRSRRASSPASPSRRISSAAAACRSPAGSRPSASAASSR
jgi:uncharacterized membrane protein YbhN (UPF0104 family)